MEKLVRPQSNIKVMSLAVPRFEEGQELFEIRKAKCDGSAA